MDAPDSSAGSPITPARPPQSRLRRFTFAVCMLLVMYAVVELLLFAAISIKLAEFRVVLHAVLLELFHFRELNLGLLLH